MSGSSSCKLSLGAMGRQIIQVDLSVKYTWTFSNQGNRFCIVDKGVVRLWLVDDCLIGPFHAVLL